MDNIRQAEPLLFSGVVEQKDNGDVALTITREDGMRKAWRFPRGKLTLFRGFGGELATAIRFMTGEDV